MAALPCGARPMGRLHRVLVPIIERLQPIALVRVRLWEPLTRCMLQDCQFDHDGIQARGMVEIVFRVEQRIKDGQGVIVQLGLRDHGIHFQVEVTDTPMAALVARPLASFSR